MTTSKTTPKLGDGIRQAIAESELRADESLDRITATKIDSKAPPVMRGVSAVLQTLPDRHRGPVAYLLILVCGLVAGYAVAKGWRL